MTLALSQEQVDLDFDEICRQERRILLCYAKSFTGDWHDAEDAVQQAFLRALDKRAEWKGVGRPGAWMMKFTRLEAMNIRRPQHREIPGSDFMHLFYADDAEGRSSADWGCMADEETASNVEAVLELLPDQRRLAVELWCLHGFSWAEVAEYMEISTDKAMALVARALEGLRDGRIAQEGTSRRALAAEVRDLLARDDVVSHLSAEDLQILCWRYVDGESGKVIAARLGLKYGTAASRVKTARLALTRAVEAHP